MCQVIHYHSFHSQSHPEGERRVVADAHLACRGQKANGAIVDMLVTIPQTLAREDVLDQLGGCNGIVGWHFMCNRLPKTRPERLWFVHQGELIGSLPVTKIEESGRPRTLRRADGSPLHTNRKFAIVASGELVLLDPMPPRKGFQGWRYFDGICPACKGLGGLIGGDGTCVRECSFCRGFGSLPRGEKS